MNCPACLSVMFNRDEIHSIYNNKNRMNLHCHNMDCRSRKVKPYYGPFMQVIINDPNPWVCHKYGLVFFSKNHTYLLKGDKILNFTSLSYATLEDEILPGTSRNVVPNPTLYINFNVPSWKEIKKFPFMSISTDNDMHKKAVLCVNKIITLLPFA